MRKTFIKKEGLAQASLACYLFGLEQGARLKTIDKLATELNLSVGIVQRALKTLAVNSCVALEQRGRNGTILCEINYPALLPEAGIGNILCAMPLPYTQLYEGLASALKVQFAGYPLYYAHMRGADVRIECLIDGVYDMALVSYLAAEEYLHAGKVAIALRMGAGSYVDGHQLIYRKGEKDQIRRVGVDPRSPDQRLLTDLIFFDKDIEIISVPYNESLARIERGNIDAAIWNASEDLDSLNLVKEPLDNYPASIKASEAVLLVRHDDRMIPRLVKMLVNIPQLRTHQQEVKNGIREPSY